MLRRGAKHEGDGVIEATSSGDSNGVHPVRGVRLGAGARAVDEILCREIESLEAEARRDPECLARPVYIVVPSRSLRLHVSSLLVREVGGALLGVRVQALDALARSIAEGAGDPLPARVPLPLLVRRCARLEKALSDHLDDLVDGYGAVQNSVVDLLDAGFDAAHLDALEACLDAHDTSAAAADRARALLRVTERIAGALDTGVADHGSRVLARARTQLQADPEAALPARAVFIHGFADATGAQADLIEALVRLRGAQVLIDRPPDPGRGEAERDRDSPSEATFGARFRERVAAAAGAFDTVEPLQSPLAPRVELVQAPGPYAEVRAVADRVRHLIDSGGEPERIAVVARDLEEYALPLRLQLDRLGVPFSGFEASGPADASGRRLAALLELLAREGDAPAERWLEALERLVCPGPGAANCVATPSQRADLREAFHQLGAARVNDVARIVPPGAALPLNARRGLSAAEPEAPARAVRREVSSEILAGAARAAASFCRRCAEWPEEAPLAAHLAQLRALVEDDLGWLPDTPGKGGTGERVAG